MSLEPTNSDSSSLGKLKTFDSFKVPAFRLFFGAQAFGWLGNTMVMIANPLLLYRLTNSPFAIGLMILATSIPSLLLSLLGGAIADRMQKKYILFASRLGAAMTGLIIALTLALGYLSIEHTSSWWIMIFCAFLNGILYSLASPATVAIIPELVGQERVMNGISLNNLSSSIFMFIVPTLAGFLIDTQGFLIIYYLMAVLNVISAIPMVFLPRSNTSVTSKSSTLGDMLKGFRYIRRETILLIILVILIFHMLGSTGYNQLTPVFTESILKVSATKLGLLISIAALASILASFIMASLPSKKRGLLFILSNIIVSLAVMGFAYSHWWYLSLGMAIFASFGMAIQMTVTPTLIQTYAEPVYRARMQGLANMAQSLGACGAFFAGALAEAIGVQWAVGGLAGLLFIITIVFWVLAKQLRRLA